MDVDEVCPVLELLSALVKPPELLLVVDGEDVSLGSVVTLTDDGPVFDESPFSVPVTVADANCVVTEEVNVADLSLFS